MSFQLIITIIIIAFLRKSLRMQETMPEWNNKFKGMVFVAVALLVLHFAYSGSDVITQWVSVLLLSWLIYILYENEEFKSVSFLLTAVIPYLGVTVITYVIKLIDIQLYNEWKQWLESANTFAVIWGFGTWFMTNRQRKELAKARKKAIEEEENNKVISAMKDQLEVQVAERTMELTKQKEELELALSELKATQSQLIQSEKMASLGELTAGIAHEIQNPLNFVNNFSEVNNELIDELKTELATGNQQLAIEIANDIKDNEQKILHHGKRADAIVKGMLQHSRASSGQIEPTDINALADEYLRLAYHGLRAKDKSFNADMKTDFDESIPKISIVPQDMGRVILNLITNAFYAVTEKKKQLGDAYEPTVSVITKKSGNSVLITVSDNGNGIPQKIVDKIFQPFFTTKPTGEGTGLGLSLSYDIVKAHGGKIRVETKDNVGAEFIIQLPIHIHQ
ncbi:MAG: GHKL domain-containing protein [Bacteroidota bacterium]|nr:GHKL domain-containing protein [Bacteroidota bacterium]